MQRQFEHWRQEDQAWEREQAETLQAFKQKWLSPPMLVVLGIGYVGALFMADYIVDLLCVGLGI